uniref:Secreted protein n=1 Tax=Arundo donax TaxID=35708 RepID=A0A0A9EEQ3_ARUDO
MIFSSAWWCCVTLMSSVLLSALLSCFLRQSQGLWCDVFPAAEVLEASPMVSCFFTASWNLMSSSIVSLTALVPSGPDMVSLWTWTWSLKLSTSAFLSVFLPFFLCQQKSAARHPSSSKPPSDTNTTMITMWCGGLGGGGTGVGGLICGGGGVSG